MCAIKIHLGGWHNGESAHHSVRVLFADLRDQECTHTGTGTTTEGVGDLETLKAVGCFSLPSDHIEDRVDELGTWNQVLSLLCQSDVMHAPSV